MPAPGSGGTYGGHVLPAVRGAYEAGGGCRATANKSAVLSATALRSRTWRQARGSSDNFIDLAYHLLKKNQVSDDLIDLQAFSDARQFLEATGLHFNGTILGERQPAFLLRGGSARDDAEIYADAGKFSFKPVLPIDATTLLMSARSGQ